jgi:hypothetical protein
MSVAGMLLHQFFIAILQAFLDARYGYVHTPFYAPATYVESSALGAYLRRQRSRLGAPKAVTATAHKLARITYNLMRYGAAYMRREEAAYAEQVRERQERQLLRRAKELGFEVKRITPPGGEPSPGVDVPSTPA